jgi:serine/threonine-protein kinase HipA
MTDRRLLTYIELDGETHLVGRMWASASKGRESATFEYDAAWLANPARFPLEPALTLTGHPHNTALGRAMFGAIGDSAPDRWGRRLIQRAEERQAREQKCAMRTLTETDYLLGVGDIARQGALRFALAEGGPFLAAEDALQVPALVKLPDLLTAAMRIAAGEETAEDLRLVLAPGSSLGGSRPKATVVDRDGHLLIAKFPQADDTADISLWEAVALTLAAKAKIATPAWRLQKIGKRPVLLLRRFDRHDGRRIPFLSAMSMLDAADSAQHSYLEIADALTQYGAKPAEDRAELWRRIVLTVLISNTDDHLRNHGFLYRSGEGWRLSPAYDLNPTPIQIKPRVLSTAITQADATASLDLAFEIAEHFGLKPNAARSIAAEVGNAVAEWRSVAKSLGLTRNNIERMASAFEHDDLARSRRISSPGKSRKE